MCKNTLSQATGTPCCGQNKRRVNEPIRKLLSKGNSQRDIADFLGINLKTVARKLVFLAEQSKKRQELFLSQHFSGNLLKFQFDELETFEHTKMKPLSIPLTVSSHSRLILGFRVAKMPAKGLLAQKSCKKYGPRPDQRKRAIFSLLQGIVPLTHPKAEILSDKNPHYSKLIENTRSSWVHKTVKGRRGCIVGSGELKVGGFDPLFSLNHTCAMLRYKVNRLVRKTWSTTKKPERLNDHLWIYMDFHNQRIIEKFK